MEKAQVGDLIRITNAHAAYGYEDGDIVEVVERWEYGDGVCIKSFRLGEKDNYRPIVYDSEYEIYRKASDETMTKEIEA